MNKRKKKTVVLQCTSLESLYLYYIHFISSLIYERDSLHMCAKQVHFKKVRLPLLLVYFYKKKILEIHFTILPYKFTKDQIMIDSTMDREKRRSMR